MVKKIFFVILFITLFFISVFNENLIVIVTDGMSFDALSIIRKLKTDPRGEISFDRFSQIFYCETSADKTYITDSAASATAIFTGYKTNNGVLGMDNTAIFNKKDGMKQENIIEFCQKNNYLTGIITNTRITHATPAGTYAHINSRNKEYDIALQLLQTNIDLIMGGGLKYFLKENRYDKKDLIADFQKKEYSIITDKNGLKIKDKKRVLALFSNSHLDYELTKDRTKEPSLSEMVQFGLDFLYTKSIIENKNFFLMIESGRIDHAAHDTLKKELVYELLETERMVGIVFDFAYKTNTAVLLVSDHSTANPVIVGLMKDSILTTMDSYFLDDSYKLDEKISTFKIKFSDISEFSANSDDNSYKGDHTASDVLGFFYSKKVTLKKIFYRNDQLFQIMKEVLKGEV